MNGCIVLMAYNEQEQRLQDELKAAQQRIKRIESMLAALN
jgi:toxic protein SymE